MADLRLLFLIGLLSFPSIALAEERSMVEKAVECLNLKIASIDEQSISEKGRPVARVLEPDEFDNVCSAQHYFCVVNSEVSWMFTWNMVVEVTENRLFAFDLWPEPIPGFTNSSNHHVYVPPHVSEGISACGVEWKGHWEGDPLFFAPKSTPEHEMSYGFESWPWNGTIEDLLPPSK